MKYLYNPATDEFESLTPTLRERFSLGSKDPTPETNTDGEVAGALMDAFPNSSFLQYQNAVEEGFQGTFEEFLRDTSDKSELDMQDIEGQTAFAGILNKLLKTSDDVSEQIAKTKTSKRGPEFNVLKKKDPKNYTEAEKLKERDLTEKIIAAASNPLYKDLFPKKVRSIKSITDLSQSELDEIAKNFTDFQFKPITDEKGLGPYSTLKLEGQKTSIRSLFKAREDAKKRPDFFSLDVGGDTFNLPYMKGIDPKTFKNFEKVYPIFKKIESNPNVENYYKQIGKLDRGEKVLINDIQEYLTGEPTRTRSVFDQPKQIQFLKSLNLGNKLSEETIELLKTQKGKDAANRFKQAKATKEATKVNLAKVNTESIRRINEIYSADPDATAKEVIDQYYGNSIKNKSKQEQAQMIKELRNDVITYYKIGAKTRKSVKGVRLPSKEKVDNILTSIMESKGRDSFDIYGEVIDKDYLKKITNNNCNLNINYKGILDYNKAPSILCNYDIAILTNEININSKYTIPGKFWEYLSCGLPIISNNRPTLKQFFKNNDIGWFVKTPKELDDCLKRLIEGKEKLSNKKNNSLKLFNKILNNQKNLN